jgi:heat-inducible transcriptional repressor
VITYKKKDGERMLKQRQVDILKLIIEIYTKSKRPVGSKAILEEGLEVSSATVRNDMVLLEKEGYLQKEHTSSGRVPTEKGYRFYLDDLFEVEETDESEKLKFHQLMDDDFQKPVDILKRAGDLLEEHTGYTSVAFSPRISKRRLTDFRVVHLNRHQILSIVVIDNGNVLSQVIGISDEATNEAIEKISQLIQKHLVGQEMEMVYSKLRTQFPLLLPNYFVDTHLASKFLNQLFDPVFEDNVYVRGKMNLFDFTLMDSVEDMKKYFDFFSDKEKTNQFIFSNTSKTLLDGKIHTVISSELGNELFNNLSLVSTSYSVRDGVNGVLALIGPMDMDYSKVYSLMDVIKHELENRLRMYYQYIDLH